MEKLQRPPRPPKRRKRLNTKLRTAQELIVTELHHLCFLPIYNLSVTHQFIDADASRSCIRRLLRREVQSNRAAVKAPTPSEDATIKTFKDYDPSYLHLVIKYLPKMPDMSHRRYLFMVIDRATQWKFAKYRDQTECSSVEFLFRWQFAACCNASIFVSVWRCKKAGLHLLQNLSQPLTIAYLSTTMGSRKNRLAKFHLLLLSSLDNQICL